MTQKSLDDIEWTTVTPEEDEETEFVRLKENEQLTGFLLDKYPSTKYKGKQIYKFNLQNDPVTKIMLGTIMLDLAMKHVEIGSAVRITRQEDKIMKEQPNNLQQYNVEIPGGE